MSRKTVELCRQLLGTIAEATGAPDEWNSVRNEPSFTDLREQRVFWAAATPKSRSMGGSFHATAGPVAQPSWRQQAKAGRPKAPAEVEREEAALFHQKCVELNRDPAYKKRCQGYTRRIVEHALYMKQEAEPRIQERRALFMERARQRDRIYSTSLQLAEEELQAKRTSMEAKEARARMVWAKRCPAGALADVWAVLLVQALAADQFSSSLLDLERLPPRITLTDYLPSQPSWCPSPMRRRAVVLVVTVLRWHRSRARTRPLRRMAEEVLRRVCSLQLWARSHHRCRLATLDALRMQWIRVMDKLLEDSRAVLRQRLETRERNAVLWAEVPLDTIGFHFPALRWPKAVQRSLMDEHTARVGLTVALSSDESSLCHSLVPSPATKQGETANATAESGAISSTLHGLLEEGDHLSRRRRTLEIRAAVQQQRLRMLAVLDATTVEPDEAGVFFIQPFERVECLTSEYHRRRHAFYLAFREWLRSQRWARRTSEAAQPLSRSLHLPRVESSAAAATHGPPLNEAPHARITVPPDHQALSHCSVRSHQAPPAHQPAGWEGQHMEAGNSGVQVARFTGRPIRRPPMFPHPSDARQHRRMRNRPGSNLAPSSPLQVDQEFAPMTSECPPPRPPSPTFLTALPQPSSPSRGASCASQPRGIELTVPPPRFRRIVSQMHMAAVIMSCVAKKVQPGRPM
eukprot:GGOE01062205.1.p1 GENE.GGOE01062205.1~~GGOE01062205.1.p1  ORF type:complete len:689 (+),score=88.68 GGOE01062205.1:110-2176(+)